MSADRRTAFVDTNILVYAHDRTAGERHDKARELVRDLWASRRGVLSTQVLQELYVTLRRKLAQPLSPSEARSIVDDFRRWKVVVNDDHSLIAASETEERFGISFWDALVIQAAITAGADVVYSEDMNDGQDYDGVKVVNPFL